MFEAIGNFLGSVAIYVAAMFGLLALYFLWVAFREWRAGARAVFGVERDIAQSEMVGALARAGGLILIALIVLGVGQLGQEVESEEGETAQATQPPARTAQLVGTTTAQASEAAPTFPPTDTVEPVETEPPPPLEPTDQAPAAEPTPQTATVTAFGGVWLRDAPNGGTIVVVPQGAIVELLEGRETAGAYEWQEVRILNVPPGSEAQVDQEGWVALQFLEVSP